MASMLFFFFCKTDGDIASLPLNLRVLGKSVKNATTIILEDMLFILERECRSIASQAFDFLVVHFVSI